MVLIIALIILVAMTLAGIALVRSVDTTNVIAGNLAFQQAATHSSDTGVEAAISWLSSASSTTLKNDGPAGSGYLAEWVPIAIPSWDTYWSGTLAPNATPAVTDAGGNQVSYVIHRLCQTAGDPGTSSCAFAPSSCASNPSGGDPLCLHATPQVYYRITARVVGPRNTVSYVQSIVAM